MATIISTSSEIRLPPAETPDELMRCYEKQLGDHREFAVLSRDGSSAFHEVASEAERRLKLKGEFPVMIAAFLDGRPRVEGAKITARRFFGGSEAWYQEHYAFAHFRREQRAFFLEHVRRQFIHRGHQWGNEARAALNLSPEIPLHYVFHHVWWREPGHTLVQTLFTLVPARDRWMLD